MYRRGRSVSDGLLTVRTLRTGGPLKRFGFAAGKRVGNAVVRNRVKRRLRHAVRDVLAELPASSELVVRALPAAAELSSAELRTELTRCLQRARGASPAAPARTGAVS